MRRSVRWKLILGAAGPLVALALATASIDHVRLKRIATERLRDSVTERTTLIADRLDRRFQVVAQIARSSAAHLALLSTVTEDDVFAVVRSNVEQDAQVYGSCVAFAPAAFAPDRARFAPYAHRTGDAEIKTIDLSGAYDYTDGNWEWYTRPATDRSASWTEPYFDEGAGNILMCTYSAPFFDGEQFTGVATVDLDIQRLQQDIEDARLEGGRFTIVSRTGTFISHPKPEYVMRESVFSLAKMQGRPDLAEAGREALAGHRVVRRMKGLDNDEAQWVCYAPIGSTGWAFAMALPEAAVMTPVYEALYRRLAVLAAGTIVVLLIVVLVAYQITRPMKRLSAALEVLGSGDLDVQVEQVTTKDEIGEFARAFNIMVKALNAKVKALTRATAAREALESELRVAREIQTSLLPQTFPPFPSRTDFQLHAANLPARQVAGDFFDFFFVAEHVLAMVMGDVSGKGVPAGMLMAVTRTLIRNLAREDVSPAEVIRSVNDALVRESDTGKFVTLFLGYYDTASGAMRFANAGHNPPYRVDAGKQVHRLPVATGIPVGIESGVVYANQDIRLDPGDLLVLYTDGVTEAMDPSGRFFGDEGLEQFLAQHAHLAPDACCDALTKAVRDFQVGDLNDDVTVLTLRRTT